MPERVRRGSVTELPPDAKRSRRKSTVGDDGVVSKTRRRRKSVLGDDADLLNVALDQVEASELARLGIGDRQKRMVIIREKRRLVMDTPWAEGRKALLRKLEASLRTKASSSIFKREKKSKGEKKYLQEMKIKDVKFQGELLEKRKQGYGFQVWPIPPLGTGDRYWGTWDDDEMDGVGVFAWFEGDIYIGQIRRNVIHGFGTYVYSYEEQWSGDKYSGEYRDGKKYGYGVYEYDDGGIYCGGFMNNRFHGMGMFVWPNNDKYQGQYSNDEMKGSGVLLYAKTQNRYEGEFCKNQVNGFGTLTSPDGSRFRGRFVSGTKQGCGVHNSAEGDVYKGAWKDGNKEGWFVVYNDFTRGAVKRKERYEAGQLVEEGAWTKGDWLPFESEPEMAAAEARGTTLAAADLGGLIKRGINMGFKAARKGTRAYKEADEAAKKSMTIMKHRAKEEAGGGAGKEKKKQQD